MAKDDRDLTRTYTRAQFVSKLRRLADAIETARPGSSVAAPATQPK